MIKNEPIVPDVRSDKYYVDLNESPFQSRPRLIGLFQNIAMKELGYKKSKVNSVIGELHKKRTVTSMVKLIDKHIGKVTVFYYGDGDIDEQDQLYRTQSSVKIKKTKKKSSMKSLEDNMKSAAKKG